MPVSFKALLIVFVASGIGGMARYGMQVFFLKIYPHSFPLGTLLVNLAGSFLIGIFYVLSEKNGVLNPAWRLALTTGFCGGFTTFSSFAYENVALFKSGNYYLALLYIALSVITGILAVFGAIALLK